MANAPMQETSTNVGIGGTFLELAEISLWTEKKSKVDPNTLYAMAKCTKLVLEDGIVRMMKFERFFII